MKKMTHFGVVLFPVFTQKTTVIKLRETKLYWVDEGGTKYRKIDGRATVGSPFFYNALELESIMPLRTSGS